MLPLKGRMGKIYGLRDVAKLGYRVCFGSRRPSVRIRSSRPHNESALDTFVSGAFFIENIDVMRLFIFIVNEGNCLSNKS